MWFCLICFSGRCCASTVHTPSCPLNPSNRTTTALRNQLGEKYPWKIGTDHSFDIFRATERCFTCLCFLIFILFFHGNSAQPWIRCPALTILAIILAWFWQICSVVWLTHLNQCSVSFSACSDCYWPMRVIQSDCSHSFTIVQVLSVAGNVAAVC